MKVVQRPIDDIKPYEKNPRLNDDAVEAVAVSIREFGFRQPIVVDADGVARWAVVSVMVGLLLALWTRSRRAPTLAALRLMVVPMMAFILMSPTVHPWYMLMVVAWLPFLTPTTDEPARRWLELVPWLYLSATLVFSYLTYRDPLRFAEVDWVRRLEWLPTLVLLGAIPLVGRLRPALEESAAVEASEAQAW